jgi:HipA-like protein
MLPERIRQLDVQIAGLAAGQLLKQSVYEFRYLRGDDPNQAALSLVMPATRPTYQDGDLFPVMEQNLPEGDLYLGLRSLFPKQALTPMHLLALIGANGIGRLGFGLPGGAPVPPARTLSCATLLATAYTPAVFDVLPDGSRLGFEDIAALMGLRVRDTQSDRKYQGSYQRVAELLQALRLPASSLQRLFDQVAFTAAVRNGHGHLKNFGVLYTGAADARLAPMFDVVTTAIYRYRRFDGGPELEDRTLALKLFAGKGETRAYPTPVRLLDFGRRVCGVAQPAQVLQRIATAMSETLAAARTDERIPRELLTSMAKAWEPGIV